MENRQQVVPDGRVGIERGADNQVAALEHLWEQGLQADPQADEDAWQTLRRALNSSRRAAEERPLFVDE